MKDFDLQEAIAVLERTPGMLQQWLSGMPDSWTRAREPEGWTAYEVVGHFICGEDMDWIPRARTILEHGDSKPFEAFDPHAQEKLYTTQSLDELLTLFAERRGANLTALMAMQLSEEDLDRPGRHPDPSFAPVTLRQLLATWVAHDLSHVGQIARILAKQYRDAVGPWRAYLPLLDR